MQNVQISRYVRLSSGQFRKITEVSFPPDCISLVDVPLLYLIFKCKGKDVRIGFNSEGTIRFEAAMSDIQHLNFKNEVENRGPDEIRCEIETCDVGFLPFLGNISAIICNIYLSNYMGLGNDVVVKTIAQLEEDINALYN